VFLEFAGKAWGKMCKAEAAVGTFVPAGYRLSFPIGPIDGAKRKPHAGSAFGEQQGRHEMRGQPCFRVTRGLGPLPVCVDENGLDLSHCGCCAFVQRPGYFVGAVWLFCQCWRARTSSLISSHRCLMVERRYPKRPRWGESSATAAKSRSPKRP